MFHYLYFFSFNPTVWRKWTCIQPNFLPYNFFFRFECANWERGVNFQSIILFNKRYIESRQRFSNEFVAHLFIIFNVQASVCDVRCAICIHNPYTAHERTFIIIRMLAVRLVWRALFCSAFIVFERPIKFKCLLISTYSSVFITLSWML